MVPRAIIFIIIFTLSWWTHDGIIVMCCFIFVLSVFLAWTNTSLIYHFFFAISFVYQCYCFSSYLPQKWTRTICNKSPFVGTCLFACLNFFCRPPAMLEGPLTFSLSHQDICLNYMVVLFALSVINSMSLLNSSLKKCDNLSNCNSKGNE